MPDGYTRTSNRERDIQPVAIVSIDTVERTAQGMTRVGTAITVDCRYPVGGHIIFPDKGEQWYVDRIDGVWRLSSKIPFNDDNTLIEPVPGQTVIGGTGPIELNGSTVNIRSGMQIGNTLYRDNDGVLESSPADADPPRWTTVSNGPVIDEDGFYILGSVPIDADGFYDPMALMISGSFHF